MCFYLRNWQVTFLLYTLGVFISEYTAKAFTEPRDYRVVFLIQTAIRAMEPDAENIWAPAGGEPVIVTVKEGVLL